MRFSEAFKSKFIRAQDVEKPVRAIIFGVQEDEVGKEKEKKAVLTFSNSVKPLVLNKTNFGTLAEAYGDDSEEWEGKPVVLFASETLFGGRMTPCIRVRVPKYAPVTEPAAPPTNPVSDASQFEADDIQF